MRRLRKGRKSTAGRSAAARPYARRFASFLSEKDLSQITVTEIAQRANRNRKTFYLHYNAIEDLISELLQEECRYVVDQLEEALRKNSGGTNEAKLYEALGASLLANFSRNSDVLRHVDLPSLIAQMRPMFAKALAERDSLGLAKALGPYLEVFVAYFSLGILGLFSQWVALDSELPLEYLSKLATATVGGGVNALVKAAAELHVDELPAAPAGA